jgi:hypothetical protein
METIFIIADSGGICHSAKRVGAIAGRACPAQDGSAFDL